MSLCTRILFLNDEFTFFKELLRAYWNETGFSYVSNTLKYSGRRTRVSYVIATQDDEHVSEIKENTTT